MSDETQNRPISLGGSNPFRRIPLANLHNGNTISPDATPFPAALHSLYNRIKKHCITYVMQCFAFYSPTALLVSMVLIIFSIEGFAILAVSSPMIITALLPFSAASH